MSTYTTTTNKLKITELDFDKIKSALKTYLSGQTEFSGYDFEGNTFHIIKDPNSNPTTDLEVVQSVYDQAQLIRD